MPRRVYTTEDAQRYVDALVRTFAEQRAVMDADRYYEQGAFVSSNFASVTGCWIGHIAVYVGEGGMQEARHIEEKNVRYVERHPEPGVATATDWAPLDHAERADVGKSPATKVLVVAIVRCPTA